MIMKWTRDSVKEFASKVEGSSARQLRSFIEKHGDGHIPPEKWEYSDFYSTEKVIAACMAKPSEAVEKLDFFIEEGMDAPNHLAFATLTYNIFGGWGDIEKTPDELESIKDVFRFLFDKGWRITDTDYWDLIAAVRAYHNDFEFLMFLSKMGLEFEETEKLDYDIVELLFENSSIDTLDYLVERGLKLIKKGRRAATSNRTIDSNLSKELIDYMISKNQPIALEDFDSDCDFDIYRYAAEKSGMKCEDPSLLWYRVVNGKRFDIGEYLLQNGIAVCSEKLRIVVNNTEAIDWALSKGFPLKIDISQCSRSTLLYAAKHGIEPCGSLTIDTKTHRISPNHWHTGDSFQGMRAICELLDIELIKAFLDAGFIEDVDASSAVEEGNQELIDLYTSYGVDTTLKRIVNGSKFVKGGIAKIPEGVEEIAHDAFYGVRFASIKLPSTLKVIGERAFARYQGNTKIKEVFIPESVTSIGCDAFKGFKKVSTKTPLAPAFKQLAKGLAADDASALERIDRKAASEVSPEIAVGFLESAAKNCSPDDIDLLYGIFSDFEYQTGALVIALTKGKTENAIALIKNGAHLDDSCRGMNPHNFVLDSIGRKAQKRIDEFYANTAETLSLKKGEIPAAVEQLIEQDAFCENDLKVLLLLAIRDGNDSLAETLRKKGALDGMGFIHIQEDPKGKSTRTVYSPAHFLSATTEPEVARAACIADPQAINRRWNKEMASKGALLKELAPYLRETTVVGCISDIMVTLATEGDIAALKAALSWPNALKERPLRLAMEAASAANNVEALALLIDVKSAAFDSIFSLSFDDDCTEMPTIGIPKFEPPRYSDSKIDFTPVPEFSIKDKVFAFLGLKAKDEEKAFAIVRDAEGIIKSSVVLKTDFLVVDENYGRQTAKYNRAIKLNEQGKNIGIITLSDFYKAAEML